MVKLQKKVAKKMNKAYVGKTVEVVYEGIDYSKALFFGRTQFQSPEIDTLVYFKSKERTDLGLRYKIKIKAVKGYDLFGEKEL